mmetsp:Transcript_47885/g.113798  ORF Transcript_47885/g.113798 Transcript_47885/m.113798 type:complete len:213 (+) Transcript_47885:60-698(+)
MGGAESSESPGHAGEEAASDAALALWLEDWQEASSASDDAYKPKRKRVVEVPDGGDIAKWLSSWADMVMEPPETSATVSDSLNPYAIVIERSGGAAGGDAAEDEDSVEHSAELAAAFALIRSIESADTAGDWSTLHHQLEELSTHLQANVAVLSEWKPFFDAFAARELLVGSVSQLLLRIVRHAASGSNDDAEAREGVTDAASSSLQMLQHR